MSNNKQNEKIELEDQRRDFLVKMLGAGAFAATGSAGILMPEKAEAGWFGSKPKKMPANRSFHSIKGKVLVNGKKANKKTFVNPTDEIVTGNNSQAIFVVGKDAFILRENSRLALSGKNLLLDGMRLVTGKLLSVFGQRKAHERKHIIQTSTATIGIRGTGVYCEADEEKTYFCNCYGVVDIAAKGDGGQSRVRIGASYHDAPKYIYKEGPVGEKIVPAPAINHTDDELLLIETLVGREVPFAIPDDSYTSPRRDY